MKYSQVFRKKFFTRLKYALNYLKTIFRNLHSQLLVKFAKSSQQLRKHINYKNSVKTVFVDITS